MTLRGAFIVSLLLASLWAATSGGAPTSYRVTVTAGPHDRRDVVVSFALPAAWPGKSSRLRGQDGKTVALQLEAGGRASFVLAELKAGQVATYQLEEGASARGVSGAGVQARVERESVELSVDGRRVMRYQGGKGELPRDDIKPVFRRGGYIHPVLTPTGRLVTDDYPPDHLHHHGIWFAWTRTEFEGRRPDFWNMGDAKATVEFDSLVRSWTGPISGGLESRHRYVDLLAPAPKVVLNETWQVTLYRVGGRSYWLFDLVSTQECATASPLVLPEYHYGGVGFRGHRQWYGQANTVFLTSEGKDRSNGHATRARWCHVGGRVDGELAGVTVMCHPENFRAPQPMRIHPTEPFFNFAPSQMGLWEIAPGRPYLSRYRFVVYDGGPDVRLIERLWNDYADPPKVTVTAKPA